MKCVIIHNMKQWHDIPGCTPYIARQVWCSKDDHSIWLDQSQILSPYDWWRVYKSRDDGPLFYYPDHNLYMWFYHNEMVSFYEWLTKNVILEDEEKAMLILTYA